MRTLWLKIYVVVEDQKLSCIGFTYRPVPPLYGVVKGSMHVFLLQLEHKSYGAVAIWEAGGGKRVPLCSRPHKLMTSVPC